MPVGSARSITDAWESGTPGQARGNDGWVAVAPENMRTILPMLRPGMVMRTSGLLFVIPANAGMTRGAD